MASDAVGARGFASSLGKRSPRNLYSDGWYFVALRMYFDGASLKNRAAHPACRNLLTLAAYGATDSAWKGFEVGWLDILRKHPLHPDYMHMNEASHLKDGFKRERGWTDERVSELVFRLAEYAATWKDHLFSSFVRIDLDAHRRVKSAFPCIAPAKRICCIRCIENIWLRYHERLITSASNGAIVPMEATEFSFDQNECFKGELERLVADKFNRVRRARSREHALQRRNTRHLFWDLVSAPVAVNMRVSPPVQLADMLAWTQNRLASYGDYVRECHAITDAIPPASYSYGEADLMRLAKRNRTAGSVG